MPKTRKTRTKSRRRIYIRNLKEKRQKVEVSDVQIGKTANKSEAGPSTTIAELSSANETNDSFEELPIESEPADHQLKQMKNNLGRRIVDISYFVKSIQEINNHSPFGCTFSDMDMVCEKRNGLVSIFTVQCKLCNMKTDISTEDQQQTSTLNVNSGAVLAMVTSGGGHSQMVEQQGIMNIPSMSYRQYNKHHNLISETIFNTAWSVMEDAGKEERELARQIGDVDIEGNGLITVIVDGAWSKRSYKVNYDAPSGVACIVGAKTGKVLFVASRNKYCPTCTRATTKNETPKKHQCFKNWQGSSTSMESDIILEGFQKSVDMHKLKYVTLIGDGDSSVYKKLLTEKPYGRATTIKKVECSNHLLRNYCSRLRDVCTKKMSSKNKLVTPKLRKVLVANIQRMRTGIKTAINYHRKESISLNDQISKLIDDIKNCPYHVFGSHDKCSAYFCKGPKEREFNYIVDMEDCGFMDDIQACGNRLIQNCHSLVLNMNNNAAETYNSIVAKFIGGKRINFAVKGGYDVRCKAAAISYNIKEDYISVLHKKITTKSPGAHTKKYISTLKKERLRRIARRTLFPTFKRKRTLQPADKDYGLAVEEPELITPSELATKRQNYLNNIMKASEDIKNIEKITRGQSRNNLWKEYRRNRLTASNFGHVCKLRKSTNPTKLVNRIVSSLPFDSTATRWGSDHEDIAKRHFENSFNKKVNECGLFLLADFPFLGASPDGIINEDEIIEIKCPYSAAKLAPEEGVAQKKIKFLIKQNGVWRLKRNHNYYYQVQGQLAITRAKFCYFVVWTPLGMIVDKIEKDEEFWKNALIKLNKFYLECMLPEIVKQM